MPSITRQPALPENGAQRIIDWYHAHEDAVRIEPSEAFQSAWMVLCTGGRLPKDLGERAVLEIIVASR